MSDVTITNQIFIDENGEYKTRCWNNITVENKRVPVMYVISTHPSQIRPNNANFCWKPEGKKSSKKGTTL